MFFLNRLLSSPTLPVSAARIEAFENSMPEEFEDYSSDEDDRYLLQSSTGQRLEDVTVHSDAADRLRSMLVDRSILAFGDSLTWGYVATERFAQVQQHPYTQMIRRLLGGNDLAEGDFEVRQSGVCGEMSDRMVKRLPRALQRLKHPPKFVLILGGTNDLGSRHTSQQILHNLIKMHEYVIHHHYLSTSATQNRDKDSSVASARERDIGGGVIHAGGGGDRVITEDYGMQDGNLNYSERETDIRSEDRAVAADAVYTVAITIPSVAWPIDENKRLAINAGLREYASLNAHRTLLLDWENVFDLNGSTSISEDREVGRERGSEAEKEAEEAGGIVIAGTGSMIESTEWSEEETDETESRGRGNKSEGNSGKIAVKTWNSDGNERFWSYDQVHFSVEGYDELGRLAFQALADFAASLSDAVSRTQTAET